MSRRNEFTYREKEVLTLILEEKTSREIAECLCISNRTVEVYRNNLLRKTGARNVAGLVKYAILGDILLN